MSSETTATTNSSSSSSTAVSGLITTLISTLQNLHSLQPKDYASIQPSQLRVAVGLLPKTQAQFGLLLKHFEQEEKEKEKQRQRQLELEEEEKKEVTRVFDFSHEKPKGRGSPRRGSPKKKKQVSVWK